LSIAFDDQVISDTSQHRH